MPRKRVVKMVVKLRRSQKPNQKRSQKPNLKSQRRRSKGAEGVMAGVCPKEFSGKFNNNNP